ncbi:MAG: CidA/LrgA family protein [Bacillota bacterium]
MKKGAQLLEGFVILLFMQSLGEVLTRSFNLILPASLTGLILLFLSLVTGLVKLEQVEEAVNLLLDNMMALFIPLNVGLITIWPLLKKEGLAIVVSLLASTIIVMAVTGRIIEFTAGRGENSADRAS